MPVWPTYCSEQIKDAQLQLGENVVAVLARQRSINAYQNQRAIDCAAIYAQLQHDLASLGAPS